MKHLFFFLLLLLCSLPSFTQISYVQFRQVPVENESEFVELETKYWSKVAKAAIDKGQMSAWTLWRKIGVTKADAPNYVFVNSYESIDQMTSNNPWGDNMESLGIDPELVSTQKLSSVSFDYWIQIEDMIDGEFKYALVNYAKPDDFEGFIMENKNIWKSVHAGNIAKGVNGMSSWGIASVIYPQGKLDRFSCYTWDGFNKFSDALNYLRYNSSWDGEGPLSDAISASRMDEIMIDGFEYRILYERAMTVD